MVLYEGHLDYTKGVRALQTLKKPPFRKRTCPPLRAMKSVLVEMTLTVSGELDWQRSLMLSKRVAVFSTSDNALQLEVRFAMIPPQVV